MDAYMEKLEKNKSYPMAIEGYASDGAGVARWDGMVVFVQGGIRGEVCQVQLLKVGKTAAWGRIVAHLETSPARVTPDCPYTPRCGGCQFRHMTYAQELEAKRTRVEDALQRIGGVTLGVSALLGAEAMERYRNKAQFPVADGAHGPRIGFYRARSHDVIDVEDCLLQPESAGAVRGAVKAWMEQWQVPAYDETRGTGLVRHVYARSNAKGESLCCLLVNGKKLPHERELVEVLRQAVPGLVGVVLGRNEARSNVILGEQYRTMWGQPFLMDTLCGLDFKLSVPSFYQVNRAQAQVLYAQALAAAGLTGTETVVDLYCGIGTISLVMAQKARRVIGAEVVPAAIEDARENAIRNGIANAEFLCGDAGQVAQALLAQGVRPSVVCVDPPRKGLAPDVVETIAKMAPQRVVYVSCDPGTLARDVKHFAQLGYQAQSAVAVDLFPRTAHVESVVRLERGDG